MSMDADYPCQVRIYREIHPHYCAERVELWRKGERSPHQIDTFAFDTFPELLDFERWIDATVRLVTGRALQKG